MNFTNDWRDNTNSVKDKLKYTLINENTQQDVVLIAGFGSNETKIKAHSFMLFIGSQVFEGMLEQAKINNDGIKEIKIPDVRPEAMGFILKYIYTDNFDMQQHDDALDVLNACLKFNLRHLAALCVSKIEAEMSAQNVIRIFEETRKKGVCELVKTSQDFILKNACDVFQLEQFLNITNEGLCKLIAFDELDIDEVSLFKSILIWGKAECERSELEENAENLRFVLKKVVPLIRFTLMTVDQFASVVVPTKILDQVEALDLFSFLSLKNSKEGNQMEPPKWIFSSSARKLTVVDKSKSSTRYKIERNCEKPEHTKKEKYLHYLKETSKTKTLSGLGVYNSDDTNEAIQNIKNITGVQPAILTFEMPCYSDKVSKWQSFTEEIISLWNNGYLIHINWDFDEHPLFQLEVFQTSNKGKYQDLIAHNGLLNREWKNQLDAIAPYFKQLQKAGVVVICDLLPCINHKAYLWGGRPGKNGSLKFYKITHDYLTKHHGLDSVFWTWSLSIDDDMTKLSDYWPGDNYVDIASVYMWDKQQLPINLYQKLLEVVGNKPISMEYIHTVPTPDQLAAQARWTWFAVDGSYLQKASFSNDKSLRRRRRLKTTFNSLSVINKENNDFFKTSERTK